MPNKQRVLSGIQPSGVLHIGNYLGAIKTWVEMQDQYESLFCVVDLHAITVKQDPDELRKKILEVAMIYMAAGVDPKKSKIFIQSHVPEHTELAWILNTITKIPELERMTQFKDKTKEHKENVNLGLFDYPVLMAADILLYQANFVPVGEDQKQHVELTRTLARRFNQTFGEVFTIPEPLIKKIGARIMGLDDPNKKMSKSADSPMNHIALTDTPDLIRKKISRAVTDSGKEIVAKPDKPALTNLLTIYSLLSGQSIKDLEKGYAGKGYAEFKKGLSETVIKFLAPFQKKLAELEKKPDYIKGVLEDGAKYAQKIAKKTLGEVKKKMGLK